MSDADRQSPRTVIRKWLQSTDSKSTTRPANALPEQKTCERSPRHRSRRHRPIKETDDPHDKEAGRKHHEYNKNESRQKNVTGNAHNPQSLQVQPQKHSKADAAVIPDDHGLAKRLGLHAPFRTFEEHSDDSFPEVQHRLQKRRRSRSSTSSYLEPAVTNDLSNNDHAHSSHPTTSRAANTQPTLGDGVHYSSPTASKDSELLLPPPETLLKPYEKRPRHKTRIDRYELKESSKHSKNTKKDAKKDRKEKKTKKSQRREKSGAALMHSFAAQNVVHDRLTLKPAKTLGLFGKGRASSPVRRKGLPDLAFSEMTFLSSRRGKPKDSFGDSSNKPSDRKKRRMLTKAADTEAEFSRYFMSTKPTSIVEKTSHRQRNQQDRRQSRDHESPQASIDLPERPFLGFGSCGPNASISPAKSSVNKEYRNLDREVSRSSTASTSYLTWSQTQGPSYASPPPNKRLRSTKFSNRKYTSPTPPKAEPLKPPVSPPRVQTTSSGAQSAASKPSLKHKTKNKALGHNSKSSLAITERLRSRERSQTCGDAGNVEPDAANVPPNIDGPILDATDSIEPAAHHCPESAPTTQNQAARQSSGREPRCKSPAHDMRPMSAPMQIVSPHRDQLDEILDGLLRDCNTSVARSNAASGATLSAFDSHADEGTRILAEVQEKLRKPAHAFVNSLCASGPPASAPNFSRGSCSAKAQLVSAIDGSMPTYAPPREGRSVSSRPGLDYTQGYPTSLMNNRINSTSAWSSYDTIYGRQQQEADAMQETPIRRILITEALQEGLIDPLADSDQDGGPCARAPRCNFAEVREGSDNYRPYLSESLKEGSEHGKYQKIRRDEWYDQHVNFRASNEAGESIFERSCEEFDDDIMALNNTNEYQEREQSLAQRAGEHENEDQSYATNVSDTYNSWRPRHFLSSKEGLEPYPKNSWVRDVDPALSDFWTPHKLY